MEKKKKIRERYEKPVLEKLDVVGEGGGDACMDGSSPSGNACQDGGLPAND